MFLENINLTNFRNYSNLKLNLNKGKNIIIGNNAAGKTNILESIFVLGLTKSFRTNVDKNLINKTNEYMKIKGKTNNNDIYELFLDDKEKIIRINKNNIKKMSDYISNLSIIMYNPESCEIIKGSPSERRKFLNIEISQLDNKYLKELNEYNKLIKIRNEYLKQKKINEIYMNVLIEKIVEKSIFIYEKRFNFINLLNEEVEKIYFGLTKDTGFNIKYVNNIDVDIFNIEKIKQNLTNKLSKNINKEKMFGSTLYGPHKDDLIFNLKDVNLKIFGSEGQKKTSIISLKLAELEIFKKIKKEYPILLLDDIFSELDINKRRNILKYINNDIQTIITTTDLKLFKKEFLNNSKIFIVNSGKVEERC